MNSSEDLSSTAITVEGIRKRMGERDVLQGVDLSIALGELVTLIGPSGCGKSTLLRAITGLVSVDSGRVLIAGEDVTNVPAEKRQIGFVFQDNALFGHLRIDRNIAFGLRHLGRSERHARVHEMLELVKLSHLARRYPHQLSGGEQQRVALARALAPQPSVIVFDEPFGALDEVLREELGWEVKEILARSSTAAILVTHARHEALTLGDRIAVMENGVILQCDTPRNVYEQPATRFVADFVGVASYLQTSDRGEILVRPHHIRVLPGGPCVVRRVEFIGATSRYTVRDERGALVVADHGPETSLAVGDACSLSLIERN